jgi:hypothetical protein
VIECAREAEVMDAVALGRWPEHMDEGLTTHVATCAVCGDLVEVARALHDDRDAACREAPVPAAGMVWWRATIRARAEAARTATQPITVLQGIAAACAVGLACGLVSVAWRSIDWTAWMDRFGGLVVRLESGGIDIVAVSALATSHALPVLLGLAACLVLAPLVLYITLADD